MRISYPDTATFSNFDGTAHGLAHCMKAVDFVIEIASHTLLIEFKDPDNPNAQPHDRNSFIEKLRSGSVDSDLVQKYRDSWLHLNASNRITAKPLRYLVLIACDALGSAELTVRTEELKKKLPQVGLHEQDWSWFIEECGVFNLNTWNHSFPDLPVTRI